jgi:hypothetical protein
MKFRKFLLPAFLLFLCHLPLLFFVSMLFFTALYFLGKVEGLMKESLGVSQRVLMK